MNVILDTIRSYLPIRRKVTPSGWISFNAICCSDTRMRGGIIFSNDSVSYHCFNCSYKANWQNGKNISLRMRKLCSLMNMPTDIINKLCLDAFKYRDVEQIKRESIIPTFGIKDLPEQSKPISDFLIDPPEDILPIVEYIYNRSLTLDDYNWYWSPHKDYKHRLIIPYFYNGKIVGYTSRSVNNTKPKYISSQYPGFVFNIDNQKDSKNFVIVCEGQFDAISLDAVAIMNNEIGPAQELLISQLKKKVVVVPDRDQAGLKMIESALKYNYSVSLPDWDQGVKDINDAVIKYGKIKTLLMIKQSVLDTELKIKLKMKEWSKINEEKYL